MGLDTVRQAKERGWRVILFTDPEANDSVAAPASYHALITPNGQPVRVDEREGYGVVWGDYTEQEAWARLPVNVWL